MERLPTHPKYTLHPPNIESGEEGVREANIFEGIVILGVLRRGLNRFVQDFRIFYNFNMFVFSQNSFIPTMPQDNVQEVMGAFSRGNLYGTCV